MTNRQQVGGACYQLKASSSPPEESTCKSIYTALSHTPQNLSVNNELHARWWSLRNLAPSDATAGLEGVDASTRTKLAIMHSLECRQYPFTKSHTNSPSTKTSLRFLNIDMRLSRTLQHQMWGSPLDLGPRQIPFVPDLEVSLLIVLLN